MTTFSQMVDKMVAELKRPDLTTEICSYVNQTIREMHIEPVKNNAIFFTSNLFEDQITSTLESGLTWSLPKISTFQQMRAVRFDNIAACDSHESYGYTCESRYEPLFADEVKPGKIMSHKQHYWYRAGNYIAFKGYGGVGATLTLSWYEYPPVLTYYPSASRPVLYDDLSGFNTYLPQYSDSDADMLIAQQLSTNWLLLRWAVVIEEGVRAKVYKRLSDDVRARTCYSMYMAQRNGVYTGESAEFGG